VYSFNDLCAMVKLGGKGLDVRSDAYMETCRLIVMPKTTQIEERVNHEQKHIAKTENQQAPDILEKLSVVGYCTPAGRERAGAAQNIGSWNEAERGLNEWQGLQIVRS
jgi:hypothetical protein